MQTAKEKASNAAASAKAGMEKTRATVQEKVDKMKAHDQTDKAMAERREEERKDVAETNKQIQKEDNAEARAASQTGERRATAGYGSRGTTTRTPVAGERVIGGSTPSGHETGGRFD